MNNDIPYYSLDFEGNSSRLSSDNPAYIDDEDLRELLIDILGDSVSESEIQKILDAASDEELSEEDFDRMIDDFILKNRK